MSTLIPSVPGTGPTARRHGSRARGAGRTSTPAVVVTALAVVGVIGFVGIHAATTNTVVAEPAGSAVADIPADHLALYRAAGSICPGVDWAVLAGIGKIETNHGRSTLPGVHSGANSAGAEGEMQFLRGTWDAVRARHPDIGPNPYAASDAIPAAAHYLCDSGATANLYRAIFQYNHADWYVREVLDQAAAYRAAG
jgi:membrane-bound lytic murein transglycosylase B